MRCRARFSGPLGGRAKLCDNPLGLEIAGRFDWSEFRDFSVLVKLRELERVRRGVERMTNLRESKSSGCFVGRQPFEPIKSHSSWRAATAIGEETAADPLYRLIDFLYYNLFSFCSL